MDRYSRVVFGFHGTDPTMSERLLRGEIAVADWSPSSNEYDWLGRGIYFWEDAPARARDWAVKGRVVGAIVNLGMCLDLTEIKYTNMLAAAFRPFAATYRRQKKRLPQNRGKRRDLDCAAINYLVNEAAQKSGIRFQSVRGAFLEGQSVFPGSAILRKTHIQIAV